MQLLKRNSKGINVLSIDDDDDAFLENGIMVLVLTGEIFTSLIQNLPPQMAQELLDKYQQANFKHCCENFYMSSLDKTICISCGKILELTNREAHNKACEKAARRTIGNCPICKKKNCFLSADTTPQRLGVCLDCWIKRGKNESI